MNTPRLVLLILLLAAPLAAAEKSDIELNDGRVLKSARIVTIGQENASILHSGGLLTVPIEQVPLDVLARAHMELEDKSKGRQKQDAEIAAKVGERIKAADEKKREEIQIRLAEAHAREASQGAEQVMGQRSLKPNLDAQLAALKAKFPPKQRHTVDVGVSQRRRSRGSDRIEIEVPSTDIWSYYRGMVQTTTVQALPITLKRIEDRIATDLEALRKGGSMSDEAANAQASRTSGWISGDLRSYLSQLHALLAN